MEISEQLFQKYNIPVPRYTSYPPATAFSTAFSNADFIEQVKLSNEEEPENISVYIHIPFCLQRCHFCGCNTVIYNGEDKVRKYIQTLKKEIEYVSQFVKRGRKVTQVSWGGGTPNSIDLAYVREIMDLLRDKFDFADFAEIAMECSPAYLDFADVDVLSEIGFNRISLGIQDFHQPVLDAINRKAPKIAVEEMLAYMKQKGFRGLNLDLVYGLPLQTIDSFRENIDTIIRLKPDRIATFSYAHVPWFNPAQKLMEHLHFPTAEEKLSMLVHAVNRLSESGYDVIGMDHFAVYDDELSIAKKNANLHRNFQGYNTKKTTGQVYAFGASGISQLNGCYAQNVKNIDQYIERVNDENMAVERGYVLNQQEKLVREVIDEVMCNGLLDFAEISDRFGISVDEFLKTTAFDTERLNDFVEDELLELENNVLKVNEKGMLIVRNIAAVFDPAYQPAQQKYSTTI